MHEYFSDISSYDGALLPGVKLPSVVIDQKYYQQLNINPSVDNFTFLRTLCERSLVKKNLNKEEYKKRLEMELGVLNELGFVDYVLLNWDITNFCHVNGIPINEGRGSAAGSLVLFLIGVTKVDSVKNELIFERFVNVSRAKTIEKDGAKWLSGSLLADVDLDIEMFRRQEVIKYIEEKHLGKTCKILTINTLSSKLCIKEVGKMIGGLSEQEVNFISDYIPKIFGKVSSFDEAIAQSDRFRAWAKENPKLINVAKKIHGLNKNTGVHPSGITISYFDINETFPTSKTKDGDIISAYDMKWVSEFAVKFDILGLRSLSVVDDVCKSVGIKIEDIDPNDSLIYESLQNLRSPHGLFQIEADVSTKVCRKVKPKNLNELSAVMSLARPGSLSFVDTYAKFTNENIIDLPDIESKELKDILSETGGSILFQETGMKICHKVFGMTLVQAENVRKACGKKIREDMMKFESIIKDYGNKHGIPKSAAFFWDALLASADYSFNRCLSGDSLIKTRRGYSRINKVQMEDEILAFDRISNSNIYVKVIDVIVTKAELYKITLENNRVIKCSLNHKFLCSDGKMWPIKYIINNKLKIQYDNSLFHVDENNEVCKGAEYSKIDFLSVKEAHQIGVRKCYDLEVDSNDHNFYCNSLVTSNSHAYSYAILSAKTVYLKHKYPQQFFLSLLKFSKHEPDPHEEISKISKELQFFGIKLLTPDLGRSQLDFAAEGPNIRFGLNSIKGVADSALTALTTFREKTHPTKFDVFTGAKQAGINVGILCSLIRAGCLSSYSEKRSRLTLEAQMWNILTDGEKRFAESVGTKYNYDILEIVSQCAIQNKVINEKGKPFMSEKRLATFREKYSKFKEMYELNRKHEKFSNWFFEKKILGYSPSSRLKTIFNQDESNFTDTIEFQSALENDVLKMVGTVGEVFSGKSKKNNQKYVRMSLKDEVGEINTLFMDSEKKMKLTEYLEEGFKIPVEGDIVCLTGKKSKSGDMLWLDSISVMDEKVFMNVSELKD